MKDFDDKTKLRVNIGYGLYSYWYDQYKFMSYELQQIINRAVGAPLWDSRKITGQRSGLMSKKLYEEYKLGNTTNNKVEDHFPSVNQICEEVFNKKRKLTKEEFVECFQKCRTRDLHKDEHKQGLLWNIEMVPRKTPREVKNEKN